jgi:23S rRNA pseudouridine1911/1915/1917 synthase
MTSLKKEFIVDTDSSGVRIDVFLARHFPGVSRTKLQRCIDSGAVLLNSAAAKKRTMVKTEDRIEVDEREVEERTSIRILPQDIDLDIMYEDEYIVAVNKPAGMVVHPGSGNKQGTMANALLFHLDSVSAGTAKERPGIIHRLDKETSGVILAAKTDEAHTAFSVLFSERSVRKEYVGFCIGKHPDPQGIIKAPIGRKQNDPLRWCARSDGKEAITEYRLVSFKSGIALVLFHPVTGRTHQIRVHCNHAGFPIIGDDLYGGYKQKVLNLAPLERPFAYDIFGCFPRHALHARRISFTHPFTKKEMLFEAPFPGDFQKAFREFGKSEFETM